MTGTLEHDALLYDSDDAYAATVIPFLRSGIAAGAGTVVATNARNRELVADELGSEKDGVVFVPAEAVYASPATAVRAYADIISRFTAEGRTWIRAIGEVSYPAEPDAAWFRYEPVAHTVFSDAPLHVLCPYDVRALPPALIDHARRSHPHLADAGSRRANPRFQAPEQLLRSWPVPLRLPTEPPELQLEVGSDLRPVRAAVAAFLARDLDPVRAEDAVLAIAETVVNAMRHGAGPTSLAMWRQADALRCVVRNTGAPITDPFAGWRPPTQRVGTNGHGLWVVRQLADDLVIGTDEQGPVVALTFRRPR